MYQILFLVCPSYIQSLCWIWYQVIVDISKLGLLTELLENEIPWNKENTTDFFD